MIKSYISPYLTIPDQEGAGFCVSCATTTVVETMLMNELKTEKVPELSRLFLQAECKSIDGNPKEQGTYPSTACSRVQSLGICEESMLPYNITDDVRKLIFPKRTDEMYTNAKQYRIKEYKKSNSLKEIKEHILKYGAVMMEENFYVQKYHKNVLIELVRKSEGKHLTAIIGFDDDFEYQGYKGAFIRLDGNNPGLSFGYGVDIIPYGIMKNPWFLGAWLLYPKVHSTYLQDKYAGTRIKPYTDVVTMALNDDIMIVNGNSIKMDTKPIEKSGTTLIPISACRKAFRKTDVDWDNNSKTALVSDYNGTFKFQIGNNKVYKTTGELVYTMDVPPEIINGRTMIPIRAFSEVLGAKVDFDSKTKKITITK